MSDFLYSTYSKFKEYTAPTLTDGDIRRNDKEIWNPANINPAMKLLELGCGTGQLLLYFRAKGAKNFIGVDHDKEITKLLPEDIIVNFHCEDILSFISNSKKQLYDRVIMLDVLEHFVPLEATRLLSGVRNLLTAQGKILVRVPNSASPWALNAQFGDLTHKMALNTHGLNQLGAASGLKVEKIYEQHFGPKRKYITDKIVNRFLSWALVAPPPFWGVNLYCIYAEDK